MEVFRFKISPNNELFRNAVEPFVSKITEEFDTLIIETNNLEKVWQIVAETSIRNNIIVNEFRSSGLEIEQIFMKALRKESKEEALNSVD